MANVSKKLLTIVELEQKLQEKKISLIEKRKQEIGTLAEKYNLLTVSNELWNDLFLELAKDIQNNAPRIKELENSGARFRCARKRHSKKINQDQTLSSTSPIEIRSYENT